MAEPILTTARLAFRPFTLDDHDLLAGLHSDPEVQRHIGGMWTPEMIQARLESYVAEQARFGLSKWKAYLHDGTFVGRVGVSLWERTGEFEIGYSLKRSAWGSGLATEGARACAEHFFRATDETRLNGFTAVDNLASRRVLERIGMVHARDQDLGYDGLSALYVMTRPD